MNFAKRVLKLERQLAPVLPPRIVVRYEGPGDRKSPESGEKIDENTRVVVVRFVAARDGRPADQPEVQEQAS